MKFKDLPTLLKIAVVLTFFNTWVMFEEFVIDRFGYWQYLPFYKYGVFCIWDFAFIALASFLVFINKDALKARCFIVDCRVCGVPN
jgi:hypothetical protein